MFKKENLRKNFLRVKQNIDQNLGRAEQSKVLTEDQQENEKRVDLVKHAFQNIAKKAGAVMQASGTDLDKKLKKLPEMALGHAMIESAQSLGTDTLLGNVCQLGGDCQVNLAREQVQYELTAEQDFITPLQTVVDVDIPSIMKFRKALSKSILDMDSAKTRLNQVVRQSQVPGANMANAAAKADAIKEEYEEATLKMENIKDCLSIELCNFASKECEHSNTLLNFLEAQASYHKKALEIIEDCIPQMRHAIKSSPAKPCYGMSLEEHLHLMCRDVALVLEACIITLLDTGMEEEGLFRIAGSAVKLKKLKASFDAHAVDMEEFSTDPHTVAGALKQYLRELPEPLLTYELYDDFMQTAVLPQDHRLQALWMVINRLPKTHYNNFRYLVKFLAKLAEKSDINKMKPSNIAIVIGPNLLWSDTSNTPNMMTTGTVSSIIEAVVTHADWFFPGAFDFHLTGHGSSPKPCREPGIAFNTKSQSSNAESSKENEKSDKKVEDVKINIVSQKTDQEKDEADCGNKEGDGAKILPVLVQSGVSLPMKCQTQKPKLASAETDEESSSDEVSAKTQVKSASDTKIKTELDKVDVGDDNDETCELVLVGASRNGHITPISSTNTGDYDNIVYSMNIQNPLYRSSTFSRASPLSTADRRGSADNVLTYGKQLPAPIPPSRPSRISKRMLPLVSEQKSPYSSFSRPVSQSPYSGSQSIEAVAYKPAESHRPNNRYLTESTPNISSLLYNRTDDDNYTGFHGPLWNRPSQKTDFHSLKRGSDPCIIPPPPQFTISGSQKSSKFSRAQLGTPPKPGEMSRSQPSPPSEMSRPLVGENQSVTSKAHQSEDTTPVGKSFHQDTYSTAFALTSLGAGTKSTDYLTRVRAMWDDRHLQHTKFNPASERSSPSSMIIETSSKGTGYSKPATKTDTSPRQDSVLVIQSTKEAFGQASPVGPGNSKAVEESPGLSLMPSHNPEVDFNMGYLYDDVQDGSTAQPQNSTETISHAQVTPVQQAAQNSVQPQSPGISPVPSSHSSSSSLPVLSESPESTSPLQRRLTRKPAPPPPPDRPYIVNVTATTAVGFKPGNSIASVVSSGSNGDGAKSANGNPFQTWPRAAPLASPESPTDQQKAAGVHEKDKQKLPSIQSERPSIQLHHRPEQAPPERPRVPPSLNPPVAARGHQRSISAGAVLSQKIGLFDNSIVAVGVPNAGSLSSYSIAEVSQDDSEGVGSDFVSSTASIQNVVPSGASHTLGRQASVRPRPTPPPPPPPTSKESEDTKL